MSVELEKCLAELEDLHDEVRSRAVAGLGRLGDPVAFLTLERIAAADPSIQLRFAAKKTLHQLRETLQRQPPPMVLSSDAQALQALLDSPEPAVRKKCLELSLAAHQLAVMPLVPALLEKETDAGVKRAALLAATLAGRHAIRVLAPFVADPEPQVRAAAMIGLGIIDDVDIFPHAVLGLSDAVPEVQRAAFRICSRLGKGNFTRLLERLAASTKAWKRLAVVNACARIRQPHLRPVVERLWEDPDDAVRQAAAAALALLGEPHSAPPPSGAPPAAESAQPPTARVVRAAPRAGPPVTSGGGREAEPAAGPRPPRATAAPEPSLSQTDPVAPVPGVSGDELSAWVRETDTARVPEIQDWFQRERDPKVRATLVAAAGKLGGRLAVEMLKRCLSDADGRVRANAVEGLRGKVRPELLVGLLTDSDNRCRANAIVAVKDHKRVDVLKHVKEMANGDAASRKSAIYAIVEIATPQAIDLLKLFDGDLDADVREKAKQAAEIAGTRAAEAEAQRASQQQLSSAQPQQESSAGKLEQLKSRIADAFGAFRKRMGK